jgi:[ribosomal protein S5]-alanine N-acetyltransferase
LQIAETARLRVRWFDANDAQFIFELLNDPAWIEYIGDKGVHTRDDARRYIDKGPLAMYERHGFGLYAVESKETGEPIGMCGLIRRDGLEDVDLGFAFLPQFRGAGYAFESASAVMAYGKATLGLRRIVAIVSQGNHASSRLLGKLGFRLERMVALRPDDALLELYAVAI